MAAMNGVGPLEAGRQVLFHRVLADLTAFEEVHLSISTHTLSVCFGSNMQPTTAQ